MGAALDPVPNQRPPFAGTLEGLSRRGEASIDTPTTLTQPNPSAAEATLAPENASPSKPGPAQGLFPCV